MDDFRVARTSNIKMWSSDTGRDGVYWIHLPHDRDTWRDLVNKVMDLSVL
jgi:hypothetical protein